MGEKPIFVVPCVENSVDMVYTIPVKFRCCLRINTT